MLPISATDAIGLAFTHTREVLAAQPFKPGRFARLALVAALTQATYLSVILVYPLQGAQLGLLSQKRHIGQQAFATPGLGVFAGGVGLALILGILAFGLLMAVLWLYVVCRLRVTLFDLVVLRGGMVGQAWRRNRRASWRYFCLCVLALLVFWCLALAVLLPICIHFIHALASARASTPGAGVGYTSQFLLTVAATAWLLLLPLWLSVDALLQDFLLPALTLEPVAPLRDAWARLGSLFRSHPLQLLLFLILRVVVSLGVALALGLVALVAIGLVALGAYGLGKLLYGMLWSGGIGAHTVFFAIVAALATCLAVLYLVSITAIYGITGTFKTSYGAYFYAGYYPDLGARLRSSPAQQTQTVAVESPSDVLPAFPNRPRADSALDLW